MSSSTFPPTTGSPGRGVISLDHVPPNASTLRQMSFQYPLKLIAPAPLTAQDDQQVQTIYLLSYGGGLIAGDGIDISVTLGGNTRLILLTQGSTKLFKSPSSDVVTHQSTVANIYAGAGLCYLPDPVQPFEQSCFEQQQTYNIFTSPTLGSGSLCVLDWVCQGRAARGEDWNMLRYESMNDVWLCPTGSDAGSGRRLLLRDNLILNPSRNTSDGTSISPSYAEEMHGMGVFGTLILCGPMYKGLADYFHTEFQLLPRIGGRKWDDEGDDGPPTDQELRRAARQRLETRDGLLWTVASLRGCTVVKLGAREVEGAKKWLKTMLEDEGSVIRRFGERALLCLR